MLDPQELAGKISGAFLEDFGVQSLQRLMEKEEWTFYDKADAP